MCAALGVVGGFASIAGAVAGIKRQRTLISLFASALLVVAPLYALTAHYSMELRMDIVTQRTVVDVQFAQDTFKRCNMNIDLTLFHPSTGL